MARVCLINYLKARLVTMFAYVSYGTSNNIIIVSSTRYIITGTYSQYNSYRKFEVYIIKL